MAWTASLVSKVKDVRGTTTITVAFTDGTETFEEKFVANGNDFLFVKRRVRDRLVRLEQNDALQSDLVVGPIDPTETPSAQDPVIVALNDDVRDLRAILELERLGCEIPNMATRKTTVQSNINAALSSNPALARLIA